MKGFEVLGVHLSLFSSLCLVCGNLMYVCIRWKKLFFHEYLVFGVKSNFGDFCNARGSLCLWCILIFVSWLTPRNVFKGTLFCIHVGPIKFVWIKSQAILCCVVYLTLVFGSTKSCIVSVFWRSSWYDFFYLHRYLGNNFSTYLIAYVLS